MYFYTWRDGDSVLLYLEGRRQCTFIPGGTKTVYFYTWRDEDSVVLYLERRRQCTKGTGGRGSQSKKFLSGARNRKPIKGPNTLL